jgi:hypothetical protein
VSEPARLVNLSAPAPKPGSTSCNQAGDSRVDPMSALRYE